MTTDLLLFLGFALLTAAVHGLLPSSVRQVFLLLFNMLFYYLSAGFYLLLMLSVGLWSFYIARRFSSQSDYATRRRGLLFGIIPIAASLCLLKYATPLLSAMGNGSPALTVLLPIGMSYYVLKAISYLYDVYKGRYSASTDMIGYLSYLTFFGQIIAGPIQRYEQWTKNELSFRTNLTNAFYPILRGLFMKLVVAARIGTYVNLVMTDPASMPGLNLWLGFFLYAIYIYADFAGYSYIAIGVTQLFGYDCPDNFRLPYQATSIRDFWSRWHISLSTWLRDYIYIPLGGNRRGSRRRVLNLFLTFLVSGIWHGSTLSFIVWGLYHGLLNACWPKKHRSAMLTFLAVAIGWVFFATPTLTDAADYYAGMLTCTSLSMTSIQGAILPFTGDNQCVAYFLVAVFFILVLGMKEINEQRHILRSTALRSYVWQVFLLTSLLLFGSFGQVSFLYAGF